MERPPEDEGWWSSWGRPGAFLVLGIVGVVAAMLVALILVIVLL